MKYDDSMMVALGIIREYGWIFGYDMKKMNHETLFNHLREHSPEKANVILEIADSIRKLNIL